MKILPTWNQKGNYSSGVKTRVYLPFRVKGNLVHYNLANATLGIKLRLLRRRLGVTITQFATKAGLGYNTIARLEKDEIKNPRPWVLGRILSAWGSEIKKAFPDEGSLFDWAIPPSNLGNCIRNLRLKRGITQTEAARLIGVSRIALYRYERNQFKPRLAVWKRLTETFGNNIPKDFETVEVPHENRKTSETKT